LDRAKAFGYGGKKAIGENASFEIHKAKISKEIETEEVLIMQVEPAKFERIEYLRSKVADMYRCGVNSPELGTIALELLTIRNEIETRCDDMPCEKTNRYAKIVRDLEKAVVSLYMLSRMNDKRVFSKENFFFQPYSLYKR
jgi:hypothetical protein